jgi:hypothetical protein
MPVNRLARVASQSAQNFPELRQNSVPLAHDDAYYELVYTDPGGADRHLPWMQDGVHTENILRYEYGTITNAEIKALRAAPKTLVAAPAGGKVLEFLSLWLFLDYGSNVLTESADNLAVKYEDGSGQAVSETIESTGFIDAAADTAMTAQQIATTAAFAKTACDGKALVLHNTGDGEIAGNAGADTVIRYKIAYRVHSAGW